MTMWPIFAFLALFLGFCSAEVTIILGGETDGVLQNVVDTVETYSPRCGLFDANLPALPKARKLFGAAHLDGQIYVCGGYNTIFSVKECYRLDLNNTAQGWVETAPMLKGRFNFHLVSAQGKLYAVGGEGPFSEHDDIEIYDPQSNSWSQSVQLTGFRLSFCAAVSENEEELYVVGGIDQESKRKRLESLNFNTMQWTRLPDMAANRTSLGCAVYDGTLIVAGGWGDDVGPNVGSITPVKSVEYYDFAVGEWFEFPEMRHRRTEFALQAYKNQGLVTAFGGYQGGHLNTIEEFDGEVDWDYLAQNLQEPKSKMAVVTVPDGVIAENCQ